LNIIFLHKIEYYLMCLDVIFFNLIGFLVQN